MIKGILVIINWKYIKLNGNKSNFKTIKAIP